MNASQRTMLSGIACLTFVTSAQAIIPPPTIEELEERLAVLQHAYNSQFAELHALALQISDMRTFIKELQGRKPDDDSAQTTGVDEQLRRARRALGRLVKEQSVLRDAFLVTVDRMNRIRQLIEFIERLDPPGDPDDNR